MNGSVQEPRFVLGISRPPLIAKKWFCTQNLPMGLSFQEKKKRFENQIVGCRDIQKNPSLFHFWPPSKIFNF